MVKTNDETSYATTSVRLLVAKGDHQLITLADHAARLRE